MRRRDLLTTAVGLTCFAVLERSEAQPVRRKFCANAGFHPAIEVIRNRILEFNTVHEKH